jgi:hypothetical protein
MLYPTTSWEVLACHERYTVVADEMPSIPVGASEGRPELQEPADPLCCLWRILVEPLITGEASELTSGVCADVKLISMITNPSTAGSRLSVVKKLAILQAPQRRYACTCDLGIYRVPRAEDSAIVPYLPSRGT